MTFAGRRIGPNGIAPKQEAIQALLDYPTPKSKTELRRLSGLAIQLSSWYPSLTQRLTRLRGAIRRPHFAWEDAEEKELNDLKEFIAKETGTNKPFNPKL